MVNLLIGNNRAAWENRCPARGCGVSGHSLFCCFVADGVRWFPSPGSLLMPCGFSWVHNTGLTFVNWNRQSHEASSSFFFYKWIINEFLYGNLKPMDTYASDSAFSHEMRFQFLNGVIMVSTWGLLFLLEIRWKLQDTKSRDLLKLFIFCSFPEKKRYQQCHSHCDDGNLNLAWGRALFNHFWVRAECACLAFNLIN